MFVHGYYVFPTATLEDQSLFVPTGIALLVLVGTHFKATQALAWCLVE